MHKNVIFRAELFVVEVILHKWHVSLCLYRLVNINMLPRLLELIVHNYHLYDLRFCAIIESTFNDDISLMCKIIHNIWWCHRVCIIPGTVKFDLYSPSVYINIPIYCFQSLCSCIILRMFDTFVLQFCVCLSIDLYICCVLALCWKCCQTCLKAIAM